MASFYDTTVGQQVEFQRVLASAGFTDSDIARIIKEPNLASTMYVAIQPKAVATVPSWYVSPEQQLARAEDDPLPEVGVLRVRGDGVRDSNNVALADGGRVRSSLGGGRATVVGLAARRRRR